ncbi:MAG: tellurite methyltransferase [Flavobacteriaceae bacterium]|jgi:tellurite methyltransferase
MFKSLVSLMRPGGTLFIRMTSDIGINLNEIDTGVHILPDGSTRYCVTRKQIDALLTQHNLKLDGLVKTVKVEELRSMTMIVFQRLT